MAAIIAVGFLLRAIGAFYFSPHYDEAASVLAAHAVVDHGLPILPSGTVYLQGATLSYLLAPLVWLGLGDLTDLTILRLVCVLAGTLAIWLGYRLARLVTSSGRVGLLAAALIALDPQAVQWSVHVRMYALLQAITIGLVWIMFAILTQRATWPRLLALVGLCWAAVFTHAGAALLIPALGVAAFVTHGWGVLRQRRLLVALASCALAPVTLLGLQRVLDRRLSSDQTGTESSPAFVGDHLLDVMARFRTVTQMSEWSLIFHRETLSWLVPYAIVAVSMIAAYWVLRRRRALVLTLLAFYWPSLIAVGFFTVYPQQRYVLHVHLLGYVLTAAVLVALMRRLAPSAEVATAPRVARWGIVALVVIGLGSGLVWRLSQPVVSPDYYSALAYVAEVQESGEPIIVALPPVAYLSLAEWQQPDLQFLAGPDTHRRADFYTHLAENGDRIDYWAGVESITSTAELRRVLTEHPDAWVVVHEGLVFGDNVPFAGSMTATLLSMTSEVAVAPGGAVILRPAADLSAATAVTSDCLPPGAGC